MSTPAEAQTLRRIVLFDGVCGLCDRFVRYLVDHDGPRQLRYAALQGTTAAELRAVHPSIPTELSTVVFVDGDRVHLRSRAVLRTLIALGGVHTLLRVFLIFPAFLTDLGYRVVARIRYAVFGRLDACRIPAPEERDLFLP